MVGIEACDDERIACLRYIGTPSRLFLMTHGDLSPLAHSGGEGARRGNKVVDDFGGAFLFSVVGHDGVYCMKHLCALIRDLFRQSFIPCDAVAHVLGHLR